MTDDLAQARRKRTDKLLRSLQVLIHEIPDEEGGCEHVGDDDVFLCWACRDVIYQREIEAAFLAHEREVLERAAMLHESIPNQLAEALEVDDCIGEEDDTKSPTLADPTPDAMKLPQFDDENLRTRRLVSRPSAEEVARDIEDTCIVIEMGDATTPKSDVSVRLLFQFAVGKIEAYGDARAGTAIAEAAVYALKRERELEEKLALEERERDEAMAILRNVLDEASMQAHVAGCPTALRDASSKFTRAMRLHACAGCAAEAVLAVEPKPQ